MTAMVEMRYSVHYSLALAPYALFERVFGFDLKRIYLQDSVEFGRKHNVSLCLEFSSHECFLAIELGIASACKALPRRDGDNLSRRQIRQSIVRNSDDDVGFRWRRSCCNLALLLQVDSPDCFLALAVRYLELKYTIGL